MKLSPTLALLTLPILLILPKATHAQEKPKAFTHEVGVDLYPLIKSVFQQNGWGWGGGSQNIPSLTYRLHLKEKMACRLRVDMDNSYNAGYTSTNTNGNTTTTYESKPSWNRTLNTKIGWQMNKKTGKVMLYYGVDAIVGMTDFSSGSTSSSSTKSGNSETINQNMNESKRKTTNLGGSLFAGVGTKLTKHIGLSYEASFDFIRSSINGNYKINSTRITKNNGQVISSNTNSNENPIDTYQQSVKLIPLGILMLSYRL